MIELIIGVALLAIAISALLGAFFGQMALNEHARNLTWAINDANRVMEQLRLRNTTPTCATTPWAMPSSGTSWDAWLTSAGGEKSIQPTPATNELIVVTCQNQAGTAYCGDGTQVGTGEWTTNATATSYDPIQITVAVCWRHRRRTLGECTWSGSALTASDGSNGFAANGEIESPAMLSTLMTCRQ